MPRAVTNMSIEEARASLEEQLEPQTDWPEPSDPLGFAAAAIAELERLEREDRESTTGF